MSDSYLPAPPRLEIPLAEVVQLYPLLRQSLLGKYDDCPLSALFDLRHGSGWSTHPQAAGTIFHRFAAEALRTMKKTGEVQIPVAEALQILYEVLRQRDVPLHERVRVPLRDMPMLRLGVIKWAKDNTFSVSRIVDIERRLFAPITYAGPDGPVERRLTGQLDVLLFAPPDEAIVIDWKHTWALPPEKRDPTSDEPEENRAKRLSYEGYFQQRFYGWLVMMTYPRVNRVTLREFYHVRGKVRAASVTRADLERIEEELGILAEAFDVSVGAGTFRLDADGVEYEVAGRQIEGDAWPAAPGKHCNFCAKPGACPIEREARGEGAVETWPQAEKYAQERQVAGRVRDHRTAATKAWVEVHGPIPLKDAKGRRMLGWTRNPDGSRNFGEFTPDASDRGPKDPKMEQAMRQSVVEARRIRDEARAERRRRRRSAA